MDRHSSASNEGLTNRSASEGTSPVRRRRHRWIWAVVLLAFGLLFYWVLHHEQKGQAAGGPGGGRRGMMGGVVPVTAATARVGSIGTYVEAIGTVTPLHTVSINAQVTGVIQQVHYREGQTVRKGDPLIDIDSRPFEAQLQQAEGVLERDQNLLAQAKMDLARYQVAWSKNAIPRQTLEDQEKLVAQTEGTVKNDEGNVKYYQVQLSFCHITSPIDGRVGLRLVDPGNLVTANSTTTLVVITQEQPTTVVFTVQQDSLPQIMQQVHTGRTLRVDALDRTQESHLATGKLASVDNQIDTTTGTVKLRAEFDNRDQVLFPNQFVNTRLLVKTLDNQILIPSSAIQHNGNQDFVYVLQSLKTNQPVTSEDECKSPQAPGQAQSGTGNPRQGGEQGGKRQQGNTAQGGAPAQCKVEMVKVKSGNSDKGETSVQGLAAGSVVADSSFEKLQDGSSITISNIKLPSASESSESTAP